MCDMKNKTRQTRHAFNSCRASRAYYKFMSVLYSSLCLHVEEEVHDIAVLDHVVLSLDSHLSGFADSALASEGHVVVILFITSARIKPFSKSVWITPAHCGALLPLHESPRAHLVRAGGEECLKI